MALERHEVQAALETAIAAVTGLRQSPFVEQRWGADPGGADATGLFAVAVGPTRPATNGDRQRRDIGVYVACGVRVRIATGLREDSQAADLTAARQLLASARKAAMSPTTLPAATVRHDSEGEELSPNGAQVWSTLELTVAFHLPLS
jgi:hypothetical protein